MESSPPSVVSVGPLKLILVSENVPIEGHANHVADDGHSVKQMVLGLGVDCFL